MDWERCTLGTLAIRKACRPRARLTTTCPARCGSQRGGPPQQRLREGRLGRKAMLGSAQSY